MFHSWFSSNRQDEADMDVGEDMIGMVKNNTKLLYKYTIQKLTKDQIGDYYLVLKKNSMLPRYRMIYVHREVQR